MLDVSDNDFDDGLSRATFLRSMEYIATERFGWPRDLVETLQYEYTDWTNPDDPVTNREQYIQVTPMMESDHAHSVHGFHRDHGSK